MVFQKVQIVFYAPRGKGESDEYLGQVPAALAQSAKYGNDYLETLG